MSTDSFDPFEDTQSPDMRHRNMMREFLRNLGLYPVGITQEDIEALNKALIAGYGTPNQIFMNAQVVDDLVKTFNK